MLTLYHGGGASDFHLDAELLSDEYWERIKTTTCRLLRARQAEEAAKLLETMPFSLFETTNHFGDEFCVLFAVLPFEPYLQLSEEYKKPHIKGAASTLSQTLFETSSHSIRFIAVGLDTNNSISEPIATPTLQVTSHAIERALADAEKLIQTRDAISGVDRVHTAFHGYLRAVVNKMGREPDKDATITQLFKIIRENHSAFATGVSPDDEIHKIVRAIVTILDALNPIRNRSSIAHPNDHLIDEPEAMLVINTTRMLLHYLDTKIANG